MGRTGTFTSRTYSGLKIQAAGADKVECGGWGQGKVVRHVTTSRQAAVQDEGKAKAAVGVRGEAIRERIIRAAAELFYAQGLRAVSADKIIERAGVGKVTFYRYFPTKDDLIVTYLERRAAWEREVIMGATKAAHGDVDKILRLVSEGIGQEACTAGFRGCPFINAAAEYADPKHPVRQVVDTHRAWLLSALEDLVSAAGTTTPTAAQELMMLRDGAMVTGYLGSPESVSTALLSAARAVLADIRQ